MKVSELIQYLSEFNGELEIIMGSDDEGNDFITPYRPSLSWCAEDDTRCGLRPVADEDINEYYDQDELVQRVVL